MLQLLASLVPIREAERGAALDAGAARVEIDLGARSLAFTLASQPIGGRALLRIDDTGPERAGDRGRTVWIDAGISQSLVTSGLLPWRDRALLAGFSRDPARIRLTNAGGTLALGRVSGRWGLREPVAAPADEEAVRRLVATLAGLEVASFYDDRTRPDGVESQPPMASLVVESDQREPKGEGFVTRTRRWSVEFRQGGGLAAAELPALVDHAVEVAETAGSVPTVDRAWRYHVTVPGERLTGLAAAPESYIARTACQTPASDIGGVSITRPDGSARVYARSLDGWNEEKDGARVPCPPEESRAIAALVSWLCGANAQGVTTRAPEGWTAAATVELRTLGGSPLVMVEVGTPAEGAPVTARVGPVWRSYSRDDAGPAAAWLAAAR